MNEQFDEFWKQYWKGSFTPSVEDIAKAAAIAAWDKALELADSKAEELAGCWLNLKEDFGHLTESQKAEKQNRLNADKLMRTVRCVGGPFAGQERFLLPKQVGLVEIYIADHRRTQPSGFTKA